MHLNKLLEQIKRHQSPTEAIDKLATALEKHEGSLLEKGFTILKSELAANMYEAINGPHFDEEHARYAVEGMENEDGTKGPPAYLTCNPYGCNGGLNGYGYGYPYGYGDSCCA